MRTPTKKMQKLKRSRFLPSILLFLMSLFGGACLLCVEFGLYASYVVETKYLQLVSDVQKISQAVDMQIGQGESAAAALQKAAADSEEEVHLALLDDNDRIVAAEGEMTADITRKTNLEIQGLQEIYWDKEMIQKDSGNGSAGRRRSPEYEREHLDAQDLAIDMLLSSLRFTGEDMLEVTNMNSTETVMECVFWQAVPLRSSGERMLVKDRLTIQRNDLFFGAAITMVSGLMFLMIFSAQFSNVIAGLKSRRKMEKLLLMDHVTGGSNWFAFLQKSEKLLRRYRNASRTYAVVDFSVAKYQGYCSLYGMKAGEELLVQLNRALTGWMGLQEVAAHADRSDFALLLSAGPGEAGRQEIMNRIQSFFAALTSGAANGDGSSLSAVDLRRLTFRAGVCFLDDVVPPDYRGYVNMEELYVNAGIAKASVSQEEGCAAACFNQQMRDEQLWENKVENTMQAALEHEEFQVYVQPKYNPSTGKLQGAEALVRWMSPTEGMIPPGRFIPIFEKTGFVTKLDDYMISHIAALQASWIAEGKQIVPVSVNVSRAHFAQPDLAEHIRSLVDVYQVPHGFIEIELTESAFFDDKRALLTTVHKLQEYGFEVSMDDFGSGYSSLNSLKDLPLNVLKLDADFFRGDDFDTRGEIVVSEAISLAKQLNMKIVAEGVEKQEQVDFLARQNCDMVQGYYYAKPMPAAEYADRLEKIS